MSKLVETLQILMKLVKLWSNSLHFNRSCQILIELEEFWLNLSKLVRISQSGLKIGQNLSNFDETFQTLIKLVKLVLFLHILHELSSKIGIFSTFTSVLQASSVGVPSHPKPTSEFYVLWVLHYFEQYFNVSKHS